MKKTIINTLLFSFALSFSMMAKAQYTSDLKINAKINAGCYLSANDVNFGVLQIPISDTRTSSNLTVHCSKNAPLTIDVSYGGIYGQGSVSYTVTNTYYSFGGNPTGIFTFKNVKTGVIENTVTCRNNGLSETNSNFRTKASISYYCSGGFVTSSQINLGSYGSTTISSPAFRYGMLSGVVKKEQIQYYISYPNDDNKVWNLGVNSYKTSGNGEEITIPLVGHIKRNSNSQHFFSDDVYKDTLTIILSY